MITLLKRIDAFLLSLNFAHLLLYAMVIVFTITWTLFLCFIVVATISTAMAWYKGAM
jgi:hypothetical protein